VCTHIVLYVTVQYIRDIREVARTELRTLSLR
jgi:hypothetical protein